MGLAEAKRKQKLVGSSISQNTKWTNDASLPGQRLLSSMGWQAGQGIGQNPNQQIAPISLALKLDNKGIGQQRLEQEARKNPNNVSNDIWIGGGGQLGSLFEKLNAVVQEGSEKALTETSPSKVSTTTINPRMAARGRYLRAKRMVSNDATSLNEILGICSSNSIDDRKAVTNSDSNITKENDTLPDKMYSLQRKRKSETEVMDEKVKKREKKRTLKEDKKERKAKRAEKRARKECKTKYATNDEKIQESKHEQSTFSDPSFNSLDKSHVSSQSVQQYLSTKLMLRKSLIAQKRQKEKDAVWERAANVGVHA